MCLEGFLGEKNSSIGHSSLQYPPQWFTSAYMGSPPPTRYHLVGQLTTATPTTRSTCTPSSWSRCPHIQWSVGHFVTSKKLWKILVRISPQDFPHTRRPWGNCRRHTWWTKIHCAPFDLFIPLGSECFYSYAVHLLVAFDKMRFLIGKCVF